MNCHRMDPHPDQVLDSPSKNSYIGSYYQPPDRILPVPRELPPPVHCPMAFPRPLQSKPNIDSRAVVDALKTLQEKIRRLDLERSQAEKISYSMSETGGLSKKELDSKLQSAESRCRVLEKQLDYMRKMVENAKKERNALMENEASQQKKQPRSLDSLDHQEKLEKLESECLKLNRTQTLAGMKLSMLEQKLLKEEHERKLVEEKACELQRELDLNLRFSSPACEEVKPKKKTKKAAEKTSRETEMASPSDPRLNKMPFVAGTSTSPSHSVHANVQSILHMMKHHQPQLCERAFALQRSGRSVRKCLQSNFSPSPTTLHKSEQWPKQADPSLGSLSDLLLALQDELGQMSFEHQELVRQIDAANHQKQMEDLQRELERLMARMDEKGAQITKLRKHQQTLHKLRVHQPDTAEAMKLTGSRQPGRPSVKTKHTATEKNLQILRQSRNLRNSIKQDDLSWET